MPKQRKVSQKTEGNFRWVGLFFAKQAAPVQLEHGSQRYVSLTFN